MFLQLNHQKLELYKTSRFFALECYKAIKQFPPEEKFNIVLQIKRAATSVHLNIAEGASRKSLAERKRFYEISRSSVVEIDAAFDLSEDLGYCSKTNLQDLGEAMIHCFKLLSGIIKN